MRENVRTHLIAMLGVLLIAVLYCGCSPPMRMISGFELSYAAPGDVGPPLAQLLLSEGYTIDETGSAETHGSDTSFEAKNHCGDKVLVVVDKNSLGSTRVSVTVWGQSLSMPDVGGLYHKLMAAVPRRK